LEIWIYPQILPYRILFFSACPSEERVNKIALFKRVPETTTYFWITTLIQDPGEIISGLHMESICRKVDIKKA